MDKLKMHSPNLTEANISKLAELFPNCITESRDAKGQLKKAVDFDLLRQELSSSIVDGPQERYQLNWPGKREALLTANAPIAKTLRPYRDESVNFDSTKNLFIEGDNLDALKLLQEAYLNKVKMIYIDPPYNTRNDFIYNDDFAESTEEYLKRSNQKDDQGARLLLNSEANGRRHSDWLSMMYSRLKLARNILRGDGVIFVSIDDNEVDNLQKLCEEIFGEDNILGRLIWKNATDNNPTNIAVEHEYVLVCCKDRSKIEAVWKSSISDVKDVIVNKGKELGAKYSDDEELKAVYTTWFRENKSQLWPLDGYKYIDRGGVFAGIRGVHNPGKEGYRYDVIHPDTGKACTEPLMGYRFPQETMKKLLADGKIIFGEDHTKLIELKVYAHEYQEKLSSLIEIDGRSGAYDVRGLFPEYRTAFENPKPVKFLQRFMPLVLTDDEDIFVDFFAGSASSAHALLDLNAKEGKSRRFILIQVPEPCGEKTEPFKHGVKSIAEISKERIRRAGNKIRKENINKEGSEALDTGFRVLKIDTSNLKDVYYTPDAVSQDLLSDQVSNIREDRKPEDLLFQVLLDWGVDLALPISQQTVAGKTVFFVDDNALVACFDTDIDEDFVKQLAARKPLRVVFRDAGFASDSVKINVEQVFKLLSPATEIKTL
jgi:adenine-specific DNA-methyltransferase